MAALAAWLRGGAGGLLLAVLPGLAPALDAGNELPGFRLADADGRLHDSADWRGEVVVIDFWASWCGPCKQSFPLLNRLAKQAGVRVVGINIDEQQADADRFLARYPARFTVLYDPAATQPERFEVLAMPSTYVFDRQGRLHWQHAGFRPADAARVETAVAAALAADSGARR